MKFAFAFLALLAAANAQEKCTADETTVALKFVTDLNPCLVEAGLQLTDLATALTEEQLVKIKAAPTCVEITKQYTPADLPDCITSIGVSAQAVYTPVYEFVTGEDDATDEPTDAPGSDEPTDEPTDAPGSGDATDEPTDAPGSGDATDEPTDAPGSATPTPTSKATDAPKPTPKPDAKETDAPKATPTPTPTPTEGSSATTIVASMSAIAIAVAATL